MFKAYEQGWKSIVKPQSFPYNSYDLGPLYRIIDHKTVKRQDFSFKNKKGIKLQGTFFHEIKDSDIKENINKAREEENNKENHPQKLKNNIGFFVDFKENFDPKKTERKLEEENIHLNKEIEFKKPKKGEEKACLIYLHSHSANRIEGLSLLDHVIADFNLCVFDFAGCGKSEGEFVTLGLKESEDLEILIGFLKKKFFVKDFFIWGRSMGAVTAVNFAEKLRYGTKLRGMVLDSPFICARTMVGFSKFPFIFYFKIPLLIFFIRL